MRPCEREARRLVDALGVESWPFPLADTAFQMLHEIANAIFEARDAEFMNTAATESAAIQPVNAYEAARHGDFADDDIPF